MPGVHSLRPFSCSGGGRRGVSPPTLARTWVPFLRSYITPEKWRVFSRRPSATCSDFLRSSFFFWFSALLFSGRGGQSGICLNRWSPSRSLEWQLGERQQMPLCHFVLTFPQVGSTFRVFVCLFLFLAVDCLLHINCKKPQAGGKKKKGLCDHIWPSHRHNCLWDFHL